MDKRCTRCQTEKPLEEFYGVKRSHCKACECVEAAERMRRHNGTFRGKASQALQSSTKAVRKVEKELGISVTNDLGLFEVAFILADETCSYCGKDVPENERQLDHVTPLRYGGANTASNCTMACGHCNREKSDTPALLHMIREVEDYYVMKLVDRLALRKQQTFQEAFEELSADARKHLEIKAEEALVNAVE
ncbi:HNH endonuclease signature motif containing protein [Halobacillus sp. K22]|uniref:HNH endonuclease signature motif containing protein n=1 Tax=Halobacillus sp. K22 TaxID=3457431 RepID=UPI003FCD2074